MSRLRRMLLTGRIFFITTHVQPSALPLTPTENDTILPGRLRCSQKSQIRPTRLPHDADSSPSPLSANPVRRIKRHAARNKNNRLKANPRSAQNERRILAATLFRSHHSQPRDFRKSVALPSPQSCRSQPHRSSSQMALVQLVCLQPRRHTDRTHRSHRLAYHRLTFASHDRKPQVSHGKKWSQRDLSYVTGANDLISSSGPLDSQHRS